jgi:hypothetical protein
MPTDQPFPLSLRGDMVRCVPSGSVTIIASEKMRSTCAVSPGGADY